MTIVARNIIETEQFINDTIADRDRARRWACSLESELAEQTDRIKEALDLLALALTWSTSENSAGFIDDAIAVLEGTS